MGFDAIWISPVVENYEDPSTNQYGYHGYWATNWEAVNSHFGSE
jgi:alpha-amylase